MDNSTRIFIFFSTCEEKSHSLLTFLDTLFNRLSIIFLLYLNIFYLFFIYFCMSFKYYIYSVFIISLWRWYCFLCRPHFFLYGACSRLDKLLVLFFSDLALHNKRREHDSHSAGLLWDYRMFRLQLLQRETGTFKHIWFLRN